MSKVKVNTVLGPIEPENMGVTLVHEHILFGYPGWEADQSIAPFDFNAAVATGVALLKQLKEFGVGTFIDATPMDCGRNVSALKEVSDKSGVHIICTTGYYFEGQGAPAYWKFRSTLGDAGEEIYELLMKEVTEGIWGTGIKAGAIKCAASKGVITDYEKMMHAASARVQKETGVPIITHTEGGTMGPEQAQYLVANGADPKRLMIGHMSDNLDLNYQLETLKTAEFVSWDRMGAEILGGLPSDADRYQVMIGMIKNGYANRMMISHDSVAFWLGRPLTLPEAAQPFFANWHPTHLFKNIIPAFKKEGVTEEQIKTIIEDNPKRLFGG